MRFGGIRLNVPLPAVPGVAPPTRFSMPQPDVTRLLLDASGDPRAVLDQIAPLVYDELHRLAHHYLRHERDDHTLSTTALVHEAYLNLVDQSRVQWQSRAHFMAIAAQTMRRVLIGYARSRGAQKRGGGWQRLDLTGAAALAPEQSEAVLALDEALTRLEALDERLVRVVEYRFFGGLTHEEAAEVLGVSPRTIKRDWQVARAWLYRELGQAA